MLKITTFFLFLATACQANPDAKPPVNWIPGVQPPEKPPVAAPHPNPPVPNPPARLSQRSESSHVSYSSRHPPYKYPQPGPATITTTITSGGSTTTTTFTTTQTDTSTTTTTTTTTTEAAIPSPVHILNGGFENAVLAPWVGIVNNTTGVGGNVTISVVACPPFTDCTEGTHYARLNGDVATTNFVATVAQSLTNITAGTTYNVSFQTKGLGLTAMLYNTTISVQQDSVGSTNWVTRTGTFVGIPGAVLGYSVLGGINSDFGLDNVVVTGP